MDDGFGVLPAHESRFDVRVGCNERVIALDTRSRRAEDVQGCFPFGV